MNIVPEFTNITISGGCGIQTKTFTWAYFTTINIFLIIGIKFSASVKQPAIVADFATESSSSDESIQVIVLIALWNAKVGILGISIYVLLNFKVYSNWRADCIQDNK